jgi:WD40 repeat protein
MRIVKLKGMRQVNGLHYAPDGRRLLAVGGYEVRSVDEARWVDVVGGTETDDVSLGANGYAVSSDLKRMAVGEAAPYYLDDGEETELPSVVIFDPTDPVWFADESQWQAPSVPDSPGSAVYALALAHDGKRLSVSYGVPDQGGFHPTARLAIVPLVRGKVTERTQADADAPACLLTFSPDASAVATAEVTAKSTTVTTYSAKSLTPLHSFRLSTNQTRQFVYSPDGNTLAVANSKSVLLLPPDLSAPRFTLAHPKQVNAVAFTPDGRRILTTCTDKLVRVWDATTGQLVVSYDWNVGVTNAIAVAPDGLTAAVSGQGGRVVLFDLDG